MRIFNLVRAIERGFSFQELLEAGYSYPEVEEAFRIRAYLFKVFQNKSGEKILLI